jgi:ABC-type multidrug transport system ATPase subunit
LPASICRSSVSTCVAAKRHRTASDADLESLAGVAGLDIVRDAVALRPAIGLAGQYAAVDEMLTGRENLPLVGQLYHPGRAERRQQAERMLQQFQLADAADRSVPIYTGGMRQRLNLAASRGASRRCSFWTSRPPAWIRARRSRIS